MMSLRTGGKIEGVIANLENTVSLRTGGKIEGVIASLENTVSLRTIPQDGVAIPRLNVKASGLGIKMFEYQGDCHTSVATLIRNDKCYTVALGRTGGL